MLRFFIGPEEWAVLLGTLHEWFLLLSKRGKVWKEQTQPDLRFPFFPCVILAAVHFFLLRVSPVLSTCIEHLLLPLVIHFLNSSLCSPAAQTSLQLIRLGVLHQFLL